MTNFEKIITKEAVAFPYTEAICRDRDCGDECPLHYKCTDKKETSQSIEDWLKSEVGGE